MSFNDRCGEALEILRHGGTFPTTDAFRAALIEILEAGQEGWGNCPRHLAYEIRDHPANAHLKAQTSDGEWYGDE